MKISVVGSGILAETTATACAEWFAVVRTPQSDADVLWLCEDTPIRENGEPDIETVIAGAERAIAGVSPMTSIVLSSQVPIGTTQQIQARFPRHDISYSPENIRVASALADFRNQTRVIVGNRFGVRDDRLNDLFAPFTSTIIWTTVETAEMVKHALNCYLGLSIAFINEIARIAEPYGCDMQAIGHALRSERRISPSAPLMAGAPFGGGHLARDIHVLRKLIQLNGTFAPIISAILESNEGS